MSEGDNRSEKSAAELEDKLEDYCHSDSLSEEGLRKFFAQHGLTTGDNQNRLSDRSRVFYEACNNERVTVGIIQCLLEYFPDTISDFDRWSPLHTLCSYNNTTLSLIQLIVDEAPDSVRSVDYDGWTTLHYLCGNDQVDDTAAMQVLKLLIDKYPEAALHADNEGDLPIHLASGCQRFSRDFVSMLVEAYPGSVSTPNDEGVLPLHEACSTGSLATVEYLYRQYPAAINHAITSGLDRGHHPIHAAISSTAVEVVKFLLNCDPNQKLIQLQGKSLLQYACGKRYTCSNIEAGIQLN